MSTHDELPRIVATPPGPRSRQMAARLAAVECPAFDARRKARAEASDTDQSPIVYARGVGVNVFDVDGNRYVDLIGGFGALVLGHDPPTVSRALEAQSQRLLLALGDVYAADIKLFACERIARLFPEEGARVMLGASGADAVTAALKTAQLATGRPGIVAFEGGYHGLSHGPLAACGLNEAFRAPFAEQINAHVTFAPYPGEGEPIDASLSAVRAAIAKKDVGAVLVEPILGRGGCVVPAAGFLAGLREICDESGVLLVVDEIWTGIGRSGAMLASAEIAPDVVCLGKGLGGGVAISACVGRGSVMQAWGAHGGSAIHTATHFGAPSACAAALAVLDALERGQLAERAARVGAAFREKLSKVAPSRGKGLMIGVQLESAAHALRVMRALLERGWLVLTGGRHGDVLTLTPPLTIPEPLLDAFVEALGRAIARA
jgi:4-aminobutyrate aminotransferase/(S)-3-amino-2-methylpropionate transaminase